MANAAATLAPDSLDLFGDGGHSRNGVGQQPQGRRLLGAAGATQLQRWPNE